MANCIEKEGNTFTDNSFLQELYNRTTQIPIKSNNNHECISVDMRNSSKEFVAKSEKFFERNANKFRILIRGIDLYIEVVCGDTFLEAYKKSYT